MKKWADMSSRERDALVAEKVMGLEVKRGRELKGTDLPEWLDEPFTPGKDNLYGTPYQQWWKIPAYSTDIAAAWLVVEKLDLFRKLGNDYCAALLTKHEKWEIMVLTGMAINDNETIAEADTVPEVICIAALKACGVEGLS
jgi:hypothetical protein